MTDNFLLFLALSVEIMLASILFTWLYNNTNGSVLSVLLLHTAMNWSIWLFSMKLNFSIVGFTVMMQVIAVLIIIRVWGAARLRRSTA